MFSRVLLLGRATVRLNGGWLGKGFWAVLDQGLFASSNFIMNILLARWLEATEYGAFGLAFAVFLFVGSIHTALLTEPMLVFAPSYYRERMNEYLGSLVYGHLCFALLGSAGLALIALAVYVWGSSALAEVILALAVASPFVLLLWLVRRVCYGGFRTQLAAGGGAIYLGLMVTGAYLLNRFALLSSATALGVMALSSFIVALWLIWCLGLKLPKFVGEFNLGSFRRHWEYGRWSIASRVLNWGPVNMYYIVLPLAGGLAAGASFKALMNLMMPMLQTISALTIVLLPLLVRAREQGRFTNTVWFALVLILAAAVFYWLVLGMFHSQIVELAYNGRYLEQAHLLWVLGLLPVMTVGIEVFSQATRALERPDRLFLAFAAHACVAIPAGIAFVFIWSLEGAVTGFVLSRTLEVALISGVFFLVLHRGAGLKPGAKGRDSNLKG